MKIGIVSDSHGDTHAIDAMLARPEVQGVECWLHAGDVAPDAEYLAMLTQRRGYKGAGNCDWPSSRVPDTEVISLAGHRILLAHGHTFGVQYDTDLFLRQAAGEECDIAVYGHTHCAEFLPGVITLINPGSIARPRDGVAGSFCILELTPDQPPQGEICHLDVPEPIFMQTTHDIHK